MEKKNKNTYVSNTVLGALYRDANNPDPNVLPECILLDEKLLIVGHARFIAGAFRIKNSYNFELKAILTQFQIATEMELFTGVYNNIIKHHARSQFAVWKEVRMIFRKLQRKYTKLFLEKEGDASSKKVAKKKINYDLYYREKASAWYRVTFEDAHPADFLSFCFLPVVGNLLCDILNKQTDLTFPSGEGEMYEKWESPTESLGTAEWIERCPDSSTQAGLPTEIKEYIELEQEAYNAEILLQHKHDLDINGNRSDNQASVSDTLSDAGEDYVFKEDEGEETNGGGWFTVSV